jgi:mRNA interferase RelE/StbE
VKLKPYAVRFTREAAKDAEKLSTARRNKLRKILATRVAVDPRSGKKLVGDLRGFYSIRLSYKDRVVYSVDDEARIIYVHRARTHYGE